jgi:ribonuclease HII
MILEKEALDGLVWRGLNMLRIENDIYLQGYKNIACIDEVGRGCLAGDVLACAVIMPAKLRIEGVNDSKKLSKKKRESLFDLILDQSLYVGIGIASHHEIDELNIKKATHMAMMRAVENLHNNKGERIVPDYLLIDAEKIPLQIAQLGIIKGDERCHGIAAASIIAKVTRDKMMKEQHQAYPEYGFDRNAGYGTREHIQAIKEFGVCQIHRKTFLKKILDKNQQLCLE